MKLLFICPFTCFLLQVNLGGSWEHSGFFSLCKEPFTHPNSLYLGNKMQAAIGFSRGVTPGVALGCSGRFMPYYLKITPAQNRWKILVKVLFVYRTHDLRSITWLALQMYKAHHTYHQSSSDISWSKSPSRIYFFHCSFLFPLVTNIVFTESKIFLIQLCWLFIFRSWVKPSANCLLLYDLFQVAYSFLVPCRLSSKVQFYSFVIAE